MTALTSDVSTERRWSRYVAIGDSFTEGMVDADPTVEDRFVGWADRLAALLSSQTPDFGYANLAVRGRLAADVVGPQVDAALQLTPDLVSIVGGGNDILRPKADLDAIADSLEAAVSRVRATGADVLMATTVDPGFGPSLLKRIRPRCAVHTANVFGIAQRTGSYVLDVWSLRALRDARMWGIDRIHLSTLGHDRVAQQAAWTLGVRSGDRDWAAPLPPAAPLSRFEVAASNAAWARDHLAPWVNRRLHKQSSGDTRSPKQPSLAPIKELP